MDGTGCTLTSTYGSSIQPTDIDIEPAEEGVLRVWSTVCLCYHFDLHLVDLPWPGLRGIGVDFLPLHDAYNKVDVSGHRYNV